jgi:hypothetical protein
VVVLADPADLADLADPAAAVLAAVFDAITVVIVLGKAGLYHSSYYYYLLVSSSIKALYLR